MPPVRRRASGSGHKSKLFVIVGDDVGCSDISYNSIGTMGLQTPGIDRVFAEGMRMTDHHGEQSCTAGRAACITGQMTVRAGMIKVGLPGADLCIRPEGATLTGLLKRLGYATGRFGKSHLGDRDMVMRFKDFPPRQAPASCSVDQVTHGMRHAGDSNK